MREHEHRKRRSPCTQSGWHVSRIRHTESHSEWVTRTLSLTFECIARIRCGWDLPSSMSVRSLAQARLLTRATPGTTTTPFCTVRRARWWWRPLVRTAPARTLGGSEKESSPAVFLFAQYHQFFNISAAACDHQCRNRESSWVGELPGCHY